MNISKSFPALCFILGVTVFTGCGKISDNNFEKIQIGMTKSEVEKILGSKGDVVQELGGGAATDQGGTPLSWVDSDHHTSIIVVFEDDKVIKKDQIGLK